MENLQSYICPNCGGQLEIKNGVFVCKSCASKFNADDFDTKLFINLLNAEKERQNANFDKAKKILNDLIKEYQSKDLSNVYWNLFLCEQNIIFFEENEKTFPLFYSLSSTEIKKSSFLQKALDSCKQNSKYEQLGIFTILSNKIESLKNECLKNSQNSNFDIFICYNTKDNKEEKFAQNLYEEFANNYNIFLESKKLDSNLKSFEEKEPVIYNALYTSKVMLLICSKKENLNDEIIKNQWSRFDKMNGSGKGKKIIIPILIEDFDTSNLPQPLWNITSYKSDITLIDNLKKQIELLIKPKEVKAREEALNKKKKMIAITTCICLVVCVCAFVGIFFMIKANKESYKLYYEITTNGDYILAGCGKNYNSENIVIESSYKNGKVISIKPNAFKDKTFIKSITIPNTVETIGFNAFGGLSSLEEITLPFVGNSKDSDTYTNFGYIFGAEQYSTQKDYIPTSLKTITITNADKIYAYAFCDLLNVKEIKLNDDISKIENFALFNCNNLEKLTIPFVGTSIDKYTNTNNPSKDSLFGYIFKENDVSTTLTYKKFVIPSTLKEVVITKAIGINSYAFYNCSNIKILSLPKTLKHIYKTAFSGCLGLEKVYFSGSANEWSQIEFSSYISNPMNFATEFYEIVNNEYILVKNLELKEETINSYAFYGFDKLETVIINDNVKTIGVSAFANCPNLASATFIDHETWQYSTLESGENATIIESENFDDPTIIATMISSNYYDKYWKKS